MKTGLLGGTFDPPHVGHLIIAQDAALALGLDRILFIPAAVPPHKREQQITPAALRLQMLQLALSGDDRFRVEPVELERTGPSYTIDTVLHLSQRDPDVEYTLLLGADQYAEFDTWREPARIRELVHLGVITRSGRTGQGKSAQDNRLAVRPDVRPLGPGARSVEATRVDISSSTIRARVAEGLPIRYMVPSAVEKFIFENGLYVRNGTAVTG